MEYPVDPFADLPQILKPHYQTIEVNRSVELYNGKIILHQEDRSWNGDGSVSLEWLPSPRILARSSAVGNITAPKLGNVRIELVDLKIFLKGDVTRTPAILFGDSENFVIEVVIPEAFIGEDLPVSSVLFHLPNFPDFSGSAVRTKVGGMGRRRLEMSGGKWNIILDSILGPDARKILEGSVGYAITHVGTIERADKKEFCLADIDDMFQGLTYFLSFCRASWVSPLLLCGMAVDGRPVSQKWKVGRLDPFRRVHHWVPSTGIVAPHFSEGFQGFFDTWQSDLLREGISDCIGWYLEASHGDIAKSVIMTQAALELLSWDLSVQHDGTLSSDGWTRLPAADKFRVLLSSRQIPLCIPSAGFKDLEAYCEEFQVTDGPGAFVRIRNILTHGEPKKRSRIKKHHGALYDAYTLGLWYIELLLLHTFGYNGSYSSRLIRDVWSGEAIRVVPWTKES